MGVATAVAIGGLAISAATTVKSFSDASKSRKLQRQAEADARAARDAARKKLEVNVYDTLAVQKEPYEREREAALVQGAMAMEAGRESERGAAAVAGQLQMGQQALQQDIAIRQGQELQDIEKLKADEESRLRDLGLQLDVGEMEGAQAAAANYEQRAAQQTAQGWEGAASTLQQGLSLLPLYSGGGKQGMGADGASLSRKGMRMASKEVKVGPTAPQLNLGTPGTINSNTGLGVARVGTSGAAPFTTRTPTLKRGFDFTQINPYFLRF